MVFIIGLIVLGKVWCSIVCDKVVFFNSVILI